VNTRARDISDALDMKPPRTLRGKTCSHKVRRFEGICARLDRSGGASGGLEKENPGFCSSIRECQRATGISTLAVRVGEDDGMTTLATAIPQYHTRDQLAKARYPDHIIFLFFTGEERQSSFHSPRRLKRALGVDSVILPGTNDLSLQELIDYLTGPPEIPSAQIPPESHTLAVPKPARGIIHPDKSEE